MQITTSFPNMCARQYVELHGSRVFHDGVAAKTGVQREFIAEPECTVSPAGAPRAAAQWRSSMQDVLHVVKEHDQRVDTSGSFMKVAVVGGKLKGLQTTVRCEMQDEADGSLRHTLRLQADRSGMSRLGRWVAPENLVMSRAACIAKAELAAMAELWDELGQRVPPPREAAADA